MSAGSQKLMEPLRATKPGWRRRSHGHLGTWARAPRAPPSTVCDRRPHPRAGALAACFLWLGLVIIIITSVTLKSVTASSASLQETRLPPHHRQRWGLEDTGPPVTLGRGLQGQAPGGQTAQPGHLLPLPSAPWASEVPALGTHMEVLWQWVLALSVTIMVPSHCRGEGLPHNPEVRVHTGPPRKPWNRCAVRCGHTSRAGDPAAWAQPSQHPHLVPGRQLPRPALFSGRHHPAVPLQGGTQAVRTGGDADGSLACARRAPRVMAWSCMVPLPALGALRVSPGPRGRHVTSPSPPLTCCQICASDK